MMLIRMMPVRVTHNENQSFDVGIYAEVPGKVLHEVMTILFNNDVDYMMILMFICDLDDSCRYFERGFLHVSIEIVDDS